MCSQDQPPSIAALDVSGEPTAAWERLCETLAQWRGVRVVKRTDRYLHVEFRSRWFRFVDDSEFLLDAGVPCIHVRSASRVGYWDFGVNRRRIERLRRQLSAPAP